MAAHNMYYLAPSAPDNLIHSKSQSVLLKKFKGKNRYPGGIIGEYYGQPVFHCASPWGKSTGPEKAYRCIGLRGAAVNYNLGFGEIAKYISWVFVDSLPPSTR